jgi:formate dehydrogenase iron-sulfur subunit
VIEMSKAFLIDTTVCMGCRGCQVACKQWHDLPAEETKNMGTYENPPDLSFNTYKVVKMREEVIDGKLNWLFFPEQCRHCIDAPCLGAADDPEAIYQDKATGAIIYTANTKNLPAAEIVDSCPYNVPRKAEDGTLAKCDSCVDRVHNGLLPACVKTCPTGAMQYGNREEIQEMAKGRLKEARVRFPKARLIDADDVNVLYLVAYDPKLYWEFAMAGVRRREVTRAVALKKMVQPFTRVLSQLA